MPRPDRIVLLLVLGTLGALAPGGAARAGEEAKESPLRWRLQRSDLLVYERHVTDEGKARRRVGGLSVYGHSLADEGTRYAPATPRTGDIAGILALTLPTEDEEKIKDEWHFPTIVPVRVKGKRRIVAREEGTLVVEGEVSFRSRGTGERDHSMALQEGEARFRTEFNVEKGHATSARIEQTWLVGPKKPKVGDKATKVSQVVELALKHTLPRRHKTFHDDVEKAIAKGVAWLRSAQVAEGKEHAGSFKPEGKHRIGASALALLTLAACDVPLEDPAMQRGLAWLVAQTPQRTYDRAIGLMALDKAYTPKDEGPRGARRRDLPKPHRAWALEQLEQLVRSAKSPGIWGYPSASGSRLQYDTSNTQYAVLGLRAARHLGLDVPASAWRGAIRHCRQVRERKGPKGTVHLIREGEAALDDGRYATRGAPPVKVDRVAGFLYSTVAGHDETRGSMACAGIAILAIARHALRHDHDALTPRMDKEVEEMVRGAWAWLDQHWAVDRHPGHPSGNWYYYWLYSLERAGILDRVKRVAGRDWYYEGSAQLLLKQARKKGYWGSGGKTAATCFALLFLKRATAPLTEGAR